MPQVASQVKEILDADAPSESLSELFCEALNWGQSDRPPQEIKVGQPVDDTFTVHPVAELGGVPVFRLHWPKEQLPLVTEKRAVYRQLQKTAREHLLCYVTEGEDNIAFVWAREQEEKSRAEMRTLPFEQDSGARTTVEQLAELKFSIEELGLMKDPGVSAVIDRLDNAFDVERVTDEFFDTYEEIFSQAEESITGIEGDEKRLFTQKVFNRLLFIRFLEKKGWLQFGDRDDYLQALWDDYQRQSDDENFYDSRLRPLFFEALSDEEERITQDDQNALSELVGQVPFLNGGLFEQSTSDSENSIAVPDEALEPIFERLFYRFNFTITESTPLDVEVAVDPEMLGKIFEELVTGRHESGSYYTPKQVVSFMCKEALKHYLMDCLKNEGEESVERFVYDRDASGLHDPESALTALRTIKVCDPACGSGAYLLGMLRELLELRGALFAARELDDHTMYQRKQEIIEQNLYGVDLDDFAVGIARLRLWLSLVVDDQRNPIDVPEAKVALPNLDYKIEAGDALTAPNPQGAARLQDEVVRQFQKKKAEYMQARGQGEKDQLQTEINELREQIAVWAPQNGEEDSFNWAVEFAEVFVTQSDPVATWTGELPLKSSGQQASMERDNASGGFDVVLANPPYLRSKVVKQRFGDDYKDRLKSLYSKTYTKKKADIYVAFFNRAHEILRPNGVGSFISSNKWLRADYGEDLRQFLLDDKAVHTLIDFGELPVFGAATDPAITIWGRENRNGYPTRHARVKNLDKCYNDGIESHINRISNEVPATHFTAEDPDERFRLIPTHRVRAHKKMRESGKKFKEYVGGEIHYGVKTGLNEAFIIDKEEKERLIDKDKSSKDIIKPLLKGDDVRKYEMYYRNRYIIFSRRGIDIKKYPAVLDRLKNFKDDLKPTPSDKRGRKPGSYKWYELQDTVDYYKCFEKPKIVYPVVGKEQRFVIDKKGYYSNDKTFIVPREDWTLVAVLNSSPVWEYLKNVCSVLGDAEEGGRVEYRKVHLENLPIPETSDGDRTEVSDLAMHIQKLYMKRRSCVEEYMDGIDFPLSESSSRNSLEKPWKLDATTFKRRAPKYAGNPDPQLFEAAKEITMELNTEIEEVEQEIDEKVAGLYGISLNDFSE